MSSRRSRSRQSSSSTSSSSSAMVSRISEDQIMELVSKLHQLLPEVRLIRHSNTKVSAGNVLQETCNHIRNLHREADDLSDRISELLATSDGPQAAIIRSLLMQ